MHRKDSPAAGGTSGGTLRLAPIIWGPISLLTQTNYSAAAAASRLTCLINLLPLMMEFEIVDIMFLVKSVKFPSGHFDIHEFVQFCSYSTRAGHSFKLKHLLCRSNYFYFNRIPRLWNSLLFLDITLSPSVIKSKLRAYFWDHFMSTCNSNNLCTYHYLCPCPKCSQLPVKMHFNVSL